MSPHLFKLRTRRFWRRRIAWVQNRIGGGGEFLERFGLSRLGRLRAVWRFLVVWLGLVGVLVGILINQMVALRPYYQTLQPIPGGRYTEGIAGTFTTANPLYAVSDVDTSVSRLLFASLLTYDDHNQLVGDLALRWQADAAGKVYTLILRPGLTWHDGQPLTAADVIYTYQTIQNPDVQSPLYASWRGVAVQALNTDTITFTLPNPLSSFPASLTNGIVPQHILQTIDPVDLRSASFNTAHPIGAGPFEWGSIGVSGVGSDSEAQITLTPFDHYWAGKPKLTTFNVYAFADSAAMIRAYQNQEITAMVGLSTVPASVVRDRRSHVYNLPLLAGVYVFFKTNGSALDNATVRKALALAADRLVILHTLGYPTTIVDEPLLKGQLGYDPNLAQATNDLVQAKALLEADGWHTDAHGVRSKSGQSLSFTLSASDAPEYKHIAALLRREWALLGVQVTTALQPAADFQDTLSTHSYQAALYGITIGVDPDVFVYWDSSQADARSATRLNFSEYKSTAADLALEAGRTRLDPNLRIVKYQSFLKAWQQDTPALALYQPRLLYISHERVYGLEGVGLATDADRFRNVHNWMIHLGWVTNP